MAKKSTADKKREESQKNLEARREAGTLRSSDVNDPLLGWDAQQGVRPASEKSRLYKDDPVVYSEDQLPRNRPEIVPEDQRGDLDATDDDAITAHDGGPQTANVDPDAVEEAEKEDEKEREEEEEKAKKEAEGDGDKKTVTKKASSKK